MIALVNHTPGVTIRKIATAFAISIVAISVSSQSSNAQDCPSGHYYRMSGRCADVPAAKTLPGGRVLFPNAQGQQVAIKRATTYAQCVRNGHGLGYGQAQIETYCQEHYAH
jgi:hypothetical protein